MKKILTTIIAFAVLSAAAIAQQPSLDNILTNYFEAIGGIDAWKKINTMKMTGETQNSGFTFPVKVIAMKPNLQRIDVDIQGQKFIESYDGEVAWSLNPFMGGTEPAKKTEDETKEAGKNMFEDEFIDYQAKGHKITFEGEEQIEGTKTYKVKMVKKTGDELFYFFDAENFVPIMMRSYIPLGPMKGKPVDTYLSDYIEVNGVVMSHYMEQRMDGNVVMNMKTTSVEFNVPLEKAAFSMPKK